MNLKIYKIHICFYLFIDTFDNLLRNNDYNKARSIHIYSGEPFEWTPFIRGQLISAYSWGNVPGNFLGGVLSQKYGPRNAVLWSSIVAAFVSLLTPIIAQISWTALAMSRVVIGITGGISLYVQIIFVLNDKYIFILIIIIVLLVIHLLLNGLYLMKRVDLYGHFKVVHLVPYFYLVLYQELLKI